MKQSHLILTESRKPACAREIGFHTIIHITNIIKEKHPTDLTLDETRKKDR